MEMVLSRDFSGTATTFFHLDAAPSAISSMVAATSIVNSSARPKATDTFRRGKLIPRFRLKCTTDSRP